MNRYGLNFFLPVASNFAPEVDHIFITLLVLSSAVLILVVAMMTVFAIRYRAGSPLDRGELLPKTWRLEIGWTTVTMLGFFGLFYWGSDLYIREFNPPADAIKISVDGKQWMWKFEQPGGQKEINNLHLPLGKPVQLIMTSEDVLHDLFIPAFRLKHDTIPGRWETIWFVPDVPGTYDLYCAQLCGADHSLMRGTVTVMPAAEYQKWLESNGTAISLAAQGEKLFVQLGCAGCHGQRGVVRAPSLAGVYGSPVPLANGTTVIADEKYLHDSILFPEKQVVASYVPVMPSFNGRISDADLEKLLAYIKSLGAEQKP